jgi:hypothetical protein
VPRRTPVQQLAALDALPLTTSVTIRRGRLRWRGNLRPSPVSECYTVRIDDAPGRRPEVTVVSPRLEVPERHDVLPHVFVGNRLCLCYPHEWDGHQLIASTLVPWTAEWLLHYEFWKADGEWHGGGHEPA